MASGRFRRMFLAAAAALACAAVAGCATTPSGGPPQPATGGDRQVQAYLQPLPPPGPTSRWTPQQVVLGFLHASASYAFDPAAARRYLSAGLRKSWHPGPVVVVADNPKLVSPANPKLTGPRAAGSERFVTFSGQYLATLSQTGQYQYAPGQTARYQFVLAQTRGVWLIRQFQGPQPGGSGAGPAAGAGSPQAAVQQTLVLTESDFEDVYQPRNLYFYAAAPAAQPGDELVPDPVYAPTQSADSALNTDLATGLVSGLLNGPGAQSWLAGDAYTAFPAGTRLLKKVTISGKVAQVDLGGAAARAPSRVYQMAAQLLATLSNGQYSPPLASQVQLSINNTMQAVDPHVGPLIPTVATGPVTVVTGTGQVSQLPPRPAARARAKQELSPAQVGDRAVTAVAAAAGSARIPQTAVAVARGRGCEAEEFPAGGRPRRYVLPGSRGPCASLSYDVNGNLWAAAGRGVWVLPPDGPPQAVDISGIASAVGPGQKILALRLAPDAVRAALLVSAPGGNQVLLAGVRLHGGAALGQPLTVGTGLKDVPLAVSWFDDYHLAVLAAGGIWRVPLTGGTAQQPAPVLLGTTPPGADARTLTTDGTELVVGSQQGAVYAAPVSAPAWMRVADGTNPVYPG